ncbi:MAG: hypothetical protein K8I60_07805, partial [Anaerolineae bacterium]|nr:hypothetical protein [Anaerolineae bacterium]
MPTETAPLSEIVAQLKAEHRPGYVYRGQIQEWMPLLPSAYRRFALPDKTFAFQGSQRMRGTGEQFVLYWPDVERMLAPEAAPIYRMWSGVFAHLRNALGYALSNILAQQAGIQSEGVDVTEDVDVAAFFATHRFDGRYYYPVEDGTGVIYRYAVTEPELTFDALRKWDFYSCPSYLPSHKIMKLFGTVETLRDCFRSVDDYCQQINWGVMFDLDAIRDKRPFEHLRMPRFTQYDSRIAHQSAGLLLPDYILTQDWAEEDFAPDAAKMPLEVGKLPAVENLALHPGTERFYFTHRPAQTAESPQEITRYYFPLADISRELLRNCVKRVV